METTIEYWGYIGIMEKKMETTIYNGIICEFAVEVFRTSVCECEAFRVRFRV